MDVVSGTLKFILTVNLNYSTEHKSLNLGAAALTMASSFLALLHIKAQVVKTTEQAVVTVIT